MTEAALAEKATHLLQSQGYIVYAEVPFWLRRIDLVAARPDGSRLLAIEVKLTKWQDAIQQACIYQLCAERVVILMPDQYAHRPDTAELQRKGIGLWAVANGIVQLVAPSVSPVLKPSLNDKLKATIRRWYVGGEPSYDPDRR